MNKNAIIGLLSAVILIGGGYLLIHNYSASNNGTYPSTVNSSVQGYTPPQNTGPASSDSGSSTATSAPNVVTYSTYAASSSTASVSGEVRPNGAPTSYWFEYGITTSLGSRTFIQSAGSSYSYIGTPAYITGLAPNTVYYYRLSAENADGVVNGAMYSLITNSNPPPQGGVPGVNTGSASGIVRTSAVLNGTVAPNGATTNYWFEYGRDTNLGGITSIQTLSSVSGSDSVSVSIANLQPLTTYYFRLNAQNEYGTVLGIMGSFTTSGPAAVSAPSATTLAASNIGNTSLQANGRINPNGGQTTYWFEYSRDSLFGSISGSGTKHQTISSGTNSVTVSAAISGLSMNTAYYYRLVAENSAGTSYGSAVSVKTR